jgi:oxaloacetate decarboxylase (Na+ extruding) subunit alpha
VTFRFSSLFKPTDRAMNEIHFVDTTLRDGQQSLWAIAMKTGMMLPILPRLGQAGFEAVEIASAAFFKKLVRELREDPLERMRLVSERLPKTPLRVIRNRYMAAFQITPPVVSDLFHERLSANGIRQIRLSDPSNTMSYCRETARSAKRAGLETVLNIIYSISPKHTDEYFSKRAEAAGKLDVARICFKDPGGLLTPESTRALVPVILGHAGKIPVELHTHCNTGLGPLCALEAIKLGVTSINTAIPPLANGSSNPSVFNVARNARALGYSTALDEGVLGPVGEHFTLIARREGLPMGRPVEYDSYHPMHQVPGGMISNFRHQLGKVGMAGRVEEVLEEVSRVRAEFGYPIMVTPYSQFVGVQAAMNVIVGERYKEVTDEVIQYALGLWGEEERCSMDADVRERILGRARAKELSKWEPAEMSLKELREKFGGPGVSDDELLLRYFAGREEVEAMRKAGPPASYLSAQSSLVTLIEELSKKNHLAHIAVQKGPLSIHMEKKAVPSQAPARPGELQEKQP